jgi:hypothetical protein
MTVELALLRCARPQLDPSREALAERVERLERAGAGSRDVAEDIRGDRPSGSSPATDADAGAGSGTASTDPAPPADEGYGGSPVAELVDLEKLEGLWPAVIDQVRQGGAELLSHVLAAARPVAVDAAEATVEVGFPPSAAFNKRKAEGNEARDTVAEAVMTVVGERLRPVFVLLESDEGGGGERKLSEEELVELMRSEFDAEDVEPEADEPEAKEA